MDPGLIIQNLLLNIYDVTIEWKEMNFYLNAPSTSFGVNSSILAVFSRVFQETVVHILISSFRISLVSIALRATLCPQWRKWFGYKMGQALKDKAQISRTTYAFANDKNF